MTSDDYPAEWWHKLDDGRIQCDLCPRECRLHAQQRGACFVRISDGEQMLLTTWGRSSGFCLDPIEKKPLNHFYPGSSVLSFGTAGCNLACKFCQNWDISKSRQMDSLLDRATPEAIAATALAHRAHSVAYTYNDPVIFAEYAIDTAAACHEAGIKSVAVTAGYISSPARERFFAAMDAANVDLKSFSEDFYHRLCGGHLAPVLDTLRYLHHETTVWLEITTLLIPGENDSDAELNALSAWIAEELGPKVPLHLTAFHPDYKMDNLPPTPLATLKRARNTAHAHGLKHVYIGNLRDQEASTTYCASCGTALIERDGYDILAYRLDSQGQCPHCGQTLAGRFAPECGKFGSRRIPLRISQAEPR